MRGRGSHAPSLHVNSITSVTERGRELEEWTDYEWSKTGDLKRLGGCWTTRWQGITVQMNHGYDLTSADFADLLKAIGTAVATAAANPLGIPEVMGPFQWQSSAGPGSETRPPRSGGTRCHGARDPSPRSPPG